MMSKPAFPRLNRWTRKLLEEAAQKDLETDSGKLGLAIETLLKWHDATEKMFEDERQRVHGLAMRAVEALEEI